MTPAQREGWERLARQNSSRARAATPQARGMMPVGLLVARFVECYGAGMWMNPAWPTRDGFIPFQLFLLLLLASANIAAAKQFEAYYVALLAGAMRNADESGRASLQRRVDDLLAQAYPEVPIDGPRKETP